MPPTIEAHYLDIEWRASGLARRIDVAPEPIEIENSPDGLMTIETQIFKDFHPWLGLRIHGELASETPAFITAHGQRQPLLAIDYAGGHRWWVQNNGWDADAKRHLSELHRTMGTFEIEIGRQRLLVENVATGLDRAQIQEYLRDFQEDLIWLVMGFGAGTATGGGSPVDSELAQALSAFAAAARRVAERPAMTIRETTVETRIARLRPNAATFRQLARRPSAQRLVGRGAEKTADIADNRYMRHMVRVCERLAKNVMQSATRHAARFEARAKMEAERSATYLTTYSLKVIPEIFDRQQAEQHAKLDQVASYSDGDEFNQNDGVRDFRINIENPYAKSEDKLFYKKVGARPEEDKARGIKYSVLQIPAELFRLFLSVRSFSREYTLRGVATVKRWGHNEDARLLGFTHVVSVTPHTQALAIKQRKRAFLEANGWMAVLSSQEREEMRQESRTAQLRGQVYQDLAQRAATAGLALSGSQADLHRQDRAWEDQKVAPSPNLPMGMRFSSNPDYAACLVAFRRVDELASRSGMGDAALDAINRIGILHASSVYERWCLIKIISILIENYSFAPEAGWQDQLVQRVTGRPESLALNFSRQDLGLIAQLEVQPMLPNGRRPDFRLRFGEALPITGAGLVMDAKFRNEWRNDEPASVLKQLLLEKNYNQEGDRVFIIQPAAHTITHVTSPLNWGRDCNFGQDPDNNHSNGVIYLAPDFGSANPVANLRRLVGLQLQAIFSVPKFDNDS